MSATASQSRRQNLKVLFLGQCIQYGYEGVDKSATFVSQAAPHLKRQFPHVELRLDLKHLYHPRGLKAILKHRLLFSRPDIVVISVVAMFAATYTRVNMLYEIAPEVVDTARSFFQKLEAKGAGRKQVNASTSLDRFLSWHPPIALDEYKRLINEGIELCQAAGCRVVLLGPGRFNEDAQMVGVTNPSPEIWTSVNEMVRNLSRAKGVAMVDCSGALSEHGGEVFLRENIRYSAFGHQVLAREVARVLASEIIILQGAANGVAGA
jgi:hypothetical protein